MNKYKILPIQLVFVSIFWQLSTNAAELHLNPSKDNSIFEEGDLSNGAGDHLFAGKTGSSGGGNFRRALLQFDLSQHIPAGSTIDSVTLTLHVNRIPAGDGSSLRPFSLHKMTSDWGEGTSNAPDEEGRGVSATPTDATWANAFHPDQAWADFPGGDFAFLASATTNLSDVGSYQWSSDSLKANVQEWVDNPEANFGWILLGPDNDRTARRFDSRESPAVDNRPLLTIFYTPGALNWGGFPVEPDGRTVDTGDYLGYIDIAYQPWVFVHALGTWIYLPEDQISEAGAWGYLPK